MRKTRTVSKSRTFIGTINKLSEFNSRGVVSRDVERVVCQYEAGGITNKTHIQIFVLMKEGKDCTRTKIQNLFGKGHWEVCDEPELAEDYCKKESSRILGPFCTAKEILGMEEAYAAYMKVREREHLKKILKKIGSSDPERDMNLLMPENFVFNDEEGFSNADCIASIYKELNEKCIEDGESQ